MSASTLLPLSELRVDIHEVNPPTAVAVAPVTGECAHTRTPWLPTPPPADADPLADATPPPAAPAAGDRLSDHSIALAAASVASASSSSAASSPPPVVLPCEADPCADDEAIARALSEQLNAQPEQAQAQAFQHGGPAPAQRRQQHQSMQLRLRARIDEERGSGGSPPSRLDWDEEKLLHTILLGRSRVVASDPLLAQVTRHFNRSSFEKQLGESDILQSQSAQPANAIDASSSSSSSSSSAIVPLSPLPPNVWRSVPTDVLGVIASHLDGRSLARMAGVDRQSRQAATRTALWSQLLLRPPYLSIVFAWRETIRERRLTRPADVYAQLYLHVLQLKRLAEHRSMRQQNDILAFRRSWPAFVLFDVLELPLLVGLLLLGVVLASVELHRNDGAVTFWSMWPFPAACAWGVVALLFAECQKRRHKREFVDQLVLPPAQEPIVRSFLPPQYHTRSTSIAKDVVEGAGGAFVPVLLIVSLFALFITLTCVRVTGSADFSWWSVSAPFYAACGLWLLVAVDCTGWMGINRAQMCGVWLCVIMPLLVFSLLLPVKLSSPSRLSLAVVFVPLWFLDLLLIGGVMLAVCMVLAMEEDDFDEWEERRCGNLLLILIATGGALIFASPFLVFKVLLCVYFDPSHSSPSSSLSYPVLFVPLYIFFALAFLLAAMIASVAWRPEQWKHDNDRNHWRM